MREMADQIKVRKNFETNSAVWFQALREYYDSVFPGYLVQKEKAMNRAVVTPLESEKRKLDRKEAKQQLLTEKKLEGNFNCCNDDVVSLNELVETMGKIVGIKPIIKFNSNADGENHDESEFPFANETFYCTNDKLKKLGIKFIPLTKGLKEDYESYYKNII